MTRRASHEKQTFRFVVIDETIYHWAVLDTETNQIEGGFLSPAIARERAEQLNIEPGLWHGEDKP